MGGASLILEQTSCFISSWHYTKVRRYDHWNRKWHWYKMVPGGWNAAFISTDPQTGVTLNVIIADGNEKKALVQQIQLKNIGFSAFDGKSVLRQNGHSPENKDTTLHSVDPISGIITDLGKLPEPNVVLFDKIELTCLLCLRIKCKIFTI